MLAYDGSVVINHNESNLIGWKLHGDFFLSNANLKFSKTELEKHLDELFLKYGNQGREFWWVEHLEVYNFDNLEYELFPHLKVLKNFIKKYNLEDKFFIYTHNWADRFTEFNIKKLCNFISFCDHGEISEAGAMIPANPNRRFIKHFLYLNRKHRHHRELFYNKLDKGDLLKNCHYSYRTYDLKNNHIPGNISSVGGYYANTSFCHLVTETQYYNHLPYYGETIFVTEKVDKAFKYANPFIVLSAPNYIKALKELGFKTFSQWWDESYDEEEKHDVRMDKIYKLVEDISSWSISKVQKVYREMIPILIHNQNLRVNISNFKRDNYLVSEDVLKSYRFCDYDQLKLWLNNLHHF